MNNIVSQNNESLVRTNEEFAKNYKRASQDGVFGPVAVGNINEFNGRYIINLCMKTVRSGDKNATYSHPVDWKLKVATGDYVNVLVQDGYVTKLMPITPKTLSSEVARSIEGTMVKQETSRGEEVISESILEGLEK